MTGRHGTPPEFQHQRPKPKGFDDFDLRLGDIMRGERATMGKSLLDVQRELKIKATYIAAIENTDPSAFESPGFVAGYVRSYARYLNLDPDWAFRTFCEEGKFDHPRRDRRRHAERACVRGAFRRHPRPVRGADRGLPSQGRGAPVAARAGGDRARSRCSSRCIGGHRLRRLVRPAGGAARPAHPVDQVPGVLAEVDPLAPAPETLALAEDSAMPAPSVEAFDRLYRPQALEVPVLVPRDGPIATLDPSTVGVFGGPTRANWRCPRDGPHPRRLRPSISR
jgi:hypothetical protein